MKAPYFVRNWYLLLSSALLIIALGTHPISYYNLLRWVVCGIAIIAAFRSHFENKNGWVLLFSGIAILFNPISAFYFPKSTWHIIDVITASLFTAFSFTQTQRDDEHLIEVEVSQETHKELSGIQPEQLLDTEHETKNTSFSLLKSPEINNHHRILRKLAVDAVTTPNSNTLIIANQIVWAALECSDVIKPYIPDSEKNNKLVKIFVINEFIYFFTHHFSRMIDSIDRQKRQKFVNSIGLWVIESVIEMFWKPGTDSQKDGISSDMYESLNEAEGVYAKCTELVSKIEGESLAVELIKSNGMINQLTVRVIIDTLQRRPSETQADLDFISAISNKVMDILEAKQKYWKTLAFELSMEN